MTKKYKLINQLFSIRSLGIYLFTLLFTVVLGSVAIIYHANKTFIADVSINGFIYTNNELVVPAGWKLFIGADSHIPQNIPDINSITVEPSDKRVKIITNDDGGIIQKNTKITIASGATVYIRSRIVFKAPTIEVNGVINASGQSRINPETGLIDVDPVSTYGSGGSGGNFIRESRPIDKLAGGSQGTDSQSLVNTGLSRYDQPDSINSLIKEEFREILGDSNSPYVTGGDGATVCTIPWGSGCTEIGNGGIGGIGTGGGGGLAVWGPTIDSGGGGYGLVLSSITSGETGINLKDAKIYADGATPSIHPGSGLASIWAQGGGGGGVIIIRTNNLINSAEIMSVEPGKSFESNGVLAGIITKGTAGRIVQSSGPNLTPLLAISKELTSGQLIAGIDVGFKITVSSTNISEPITVVDSFNPEIMVITDLGGGSLVGNTITWSIPGEVIYNNQTKIYTFNFSAKIKNDPTIVCGKYPNTALSATTASGIITATGNTSNLIVICSSINGDIYSGNPLVFKPNMLISQNSVVSSKGSITLNGQSISTFSNNELNNNLIFPTNDVLLKSAQIIDPTDFKQNTALILNLDGKLRIGGSQASADSANGGIWQISDLENRFGEQSSINYINRGTIVSTSTNQLNISADIKRQNLNDANQFMGLISKSDVNIKASTVGKRLTLDLCLYAPNNTVTLDLSNGGDLYYSGQIIARQIIIKSADSSVLILNYDNSLQLKPLPLFSQIFKVTNNEVTP